MKINCLHCGHAFGLDDSYGDYEGLVRCPTCSGLLDLRIEDEMVKAVRPGSLAPVVPAATPLVNADAQTTALESSGSQAAVPNTAAPASQAAA